MLKQERKMIIIKKVQFSQCSKKKLGGNATNFYLGNFLNSSATCIGKGSSCGQKTKFLVFTGKCFRNLWLC